tara:strand:+ start:426 stop:839 length:414 start_codon:yes stop_codon:yes gene_type:complete
MKVDEIQPIVDYAYPKIQKYYGTGKLSVPPIKFHVDIFARLSGIDDMRGEESKSSKAQYEEETNTIWIYYPNMKNEEDVLRSLIHEYTHYTEVKDLEDEKERSDLFAKYKAMHDYDEDPTEVKAKKNEEDWHLFSQK